MSGSDSASPDPSDISPGETPEAQSRQIFSRPNSEKKKSSYALLYERIPAKKNVRPKKTSVFLGSDSAVLSDRDIAQEMKQGNIFISPFRQTILNNCSYDVTLGDSFFRASPDFARSVAPGDEEVSLFNPFNPRHARAYWGPCEKGKEPSEREAEILGVSAGTPLIILQPGETILAHTAEFIGGKKHITTMLRAKSTMARSNITVCRDAGWGDVGYINRWAMMITNLSGVAVALPVGARVAQIIFLYTSEPQNSYTRHGNYQAVEDPEVMIREWKPEDLLPKVK